MPAVNAALVAGYEGMIRCGRPCRMEIYFQGDRSPIIVNGFIVVMLRFVQVKFSEMTIDMFRMMQTLEREKNRDEINHVSDPPSRASFVSSNRLFALFLC